MYILAIETTGAFASVALLADDKIVAEIHGNDRFSHLQNLVPQVEAAIKKCELALGDVTAIAVSCGPGSFTGIRIGVASARALSQALNIPCIEVPSLEALAMNAIAMPHTDVVDADAREGCSIMQSADKGSQSCSGEAAGRRAGAGEGQVDSGYADQTLICPILDARRSQVYGGGYYLENGFAAEQVKAAAYTIEEFMEAVSSYERILLLGDGADAYRERIAELRPYGTKTAPESIRYQNAVSAAKLGAKIFRKAGGLAYNDVKPNYMRLAEAERKLKEKQNKS